MNTENEVTADGLQRGVQLRIPLHIAFGPSVGRVGYNDLHDGRTETSDPRDSTAVKLDDTSISPIRKHNVSKISTPYIAEQGDGEETTDRSDPSPSTRILKSRNDFRTSLEVYIADNPTADLPTLAEGIAGIYVKQGQEKNTNTIDGLKSNSEHLLYMLENLTEIRENVLALAVPHPPEIKGYIADEVTLADNVTATNTHYVKGKANKRKGIITYNSEVLAHPRIIPMSMNILGVHPRKATAPNLCIQDFLKIDAQNRAAYDARRAEKRFFGESVSDNAAKQFVSELEAELEDKRLNGYIARNTPKKTGLLQRSLNSIANYVSEQADNLCNKAAIATAAVGTLASAALLVYTAAANVVNEVKHEIYMRPHSTYSVQNSAANVGTSAMMQEAPMYRTPALETVVEQQPARMYRSKTAPHITTESDGDFGYSFNYRSGNMYRSDATVRDIQKSSAREAKVGKGPVTVIDNRPRSKLPESIRSHKSYR